MKPYLLLVLGQLAAAEPFFDAAAMAAKQVLVMLECKDENEGCGSWAAGGECARNPGFMHGTCRKACGRCELQDEDARHALEVVAYATRNHYAGCAAAQRRGDIRVPQCDGSSERLAAVLAITQEQARGKALQRFIEALAHELAASSAPITSGHMPRALGSAEGEHPSSPEMLAASVGTGSNARFVALSDGGQMPAVGLGTWLTVGQACFDMVSAGLRAGLRHIDTSENYQNHEEIGRALKASSVPRAELFLADKLSFPQSYSAAGVRKAVSDSMSKLGVEYLDLYMLHSVGPSVSARHEAWQAMIDLQKAGTLRHIGVSNFGTAELRDLKAAFPANPPATLQSKFNPYHRGRTGNAGREDFHTVCAELGIIVTAYCPLNDWPSKLKAVDDVHVAAIAKRLGKTPAQVLLRWGVQLGMTMLTRSSREDRLTQATQIFDFSLTDSDMALISGLAWFVDAPTNRVPPTVIDRYGVQAMDATAYKKVPPRGTAVVEEPIRACDMAWSMLGGGAGRKVEL